MKPLLVFPPLVSGAYGTAYPSLAVLSAVLKSARISAIQADLNGEYLDFCSSRLRSLRTFYKHLFESDRRFSVRPLWLGISIAMAEQLEPALALAAKTRKAWGTSTPILFGGPVCSLLNAEEQLQILKTGNVDAICKQEGEACVLAVSHQLRKRKKSIDWQQVPQVSFLAKGKLIRSELRKSIPLDELPPPDYDLPALRRWDIQALSLVTGRKCYWGKCRYCDYQNLYCSKDQLSPEIAVEQLHRLKRKTGVNCFWLCTDSLTPEFARSFSKELLRRGTGIQWMAYIRVDRGYSRSTLELMRRSGCRSLVVGLESLDDQVLTLVNKGYSRATALTFLRQLARAQIPWMINLIIDLPGTSYHSALHQFKLLKQIHHQSKMKPKFSIFHFDLSRSSPMGKNPARFGLILKDGSPDIANHINALKWKDPRGMSKQQKLEVCEQYEGLLALK